MKFHKCEHCGITCKKTFRRAFCSDKCRFLGYIDKKDDCWIWIGKVANDGYGVVMINGKRIRSHRYSYEMFKGPINNGMLILHSCHNPHCVNPDHLREGTVRENAQDMINAKRDLYGEKGTASKLKEENIKEIIDLYNTGTVSQQQIADHFCVSQVAIGAIIRRKTWKHVKF
jgi:hypothetical protein